MIRDILSVLRGVVAETTLSVLARAQHSVIVQLAEKIQLQEAKITELEKRAGLGVHERNDRTEQDVAFSWVKKTFGTSNAIPIERARRFFEEACELVQSHNLPKSQAMDLLSYVYSRPSGDSASETGGVMVTLWALCAATGISAVACGREELRRVLNGDVGEQRRKHNHKADSRLAAPVELDR